jgi:hypothetical protein
MLTMLTDFSAVASKSAPAGKPRFRGSYSTLGLTAAALLNALLLWLFLAPMRSTPVYDLPQFYIASSLMRAGKTAELYNPSAYQPFIEDLRKSNPKAADHSLYFNRPAFEAPLFFPLSFFSFGTASTLVVVVNVALLAALIWLLPRWFPVKEHMRIWLIVYMPFLYSVFLGQDTLLLTLLVAASFRLTLDECDVAAGALLALATFKPHVIFLVPIAILVSRRWELLASFSAASAALATLSFAMVGKRGFEQWFRLLGAPTTDVLPWGMGNIRALTFHFSAVLVSMAVAVTVIALGVTLWRRPLIWKLSATLVAGLLLSPHTYIQDYSVAAIVGLAALHPVLRYALFLPWTYFHPTFGSRDVVPFVVLAIVCLVNLACGGSLPSLKSNAKRRNEEARARQE